MLKINKLTTVVLAALILACANAVMAGDVTGIRFPEQRQAVKIVPGEDGSDLGDFSGRGSKMVAHLQDLGVSLTRIGVAWADCEKVRGQAYDWTIPDEIINFFSDRGIEPMVVLFSCPQWARTTHPDDKTREREAGVPYVDLQVPKLGYEKDYAKWAEAVAKRYKGRVRYYEFWNEPDGIPGPILFRDKSGMLIGGRTGGDPVLYAHWLKTAHDALKKGNPDAKLAAGSLSVCDTRFMEAIYNAVGKDAFEAISYHPYLGEGINAHWTRQLRELCLRYGDPECELWITEYDWTPKDHRDKNWSSTYGCGDAAEKLPSDGVRICSHYPYITQVYLHTLNDWGDAAGYLPWQGFGLLNMQLEKKPKYDEYKEALLWRSEALAREMCIKGPSIVFPGQEFQLSVEPTLAADVGKLDWFVPKSWRVTQDAGGSAKYSVRVPANAASGDPYPMTAQNERGYSFSHYVEVVEPLQLANVMVKEGAYKSTPAKAAALINNFDDAALKGELKFDLPQGWNVIGPLGVDCPANTKMTRIVEIAADSNVAAGIYKATARLYYSGRQCRTYDFQLIKEAECPGLKQPKVIDGNLSDWLNTDWVKIPGNASDSDFAVAWDANCLYAAVRVHDEKHVQSLSIKDSWSQDSVQFSFDPLCDGVPGGMPTLDDYEFIFAISNDGSQQCRFACPPGSYSGKVDGLKFAGVVGDNLTVYEIAIPWNELKPAKRKVGSSIGMSVLINGSDGSERKTSAWGSGIASLKSPIDYSRIRLVD